LNSLPKQVDAFIAEVQQLWDVPGVAVAVVRRDGPVHVRAYGVRSVATSVPADIDTAFAVGSCSKAFDFRVGGSASRCCCDRLGRSNSEISAVIPIV
jgi:hypothetical protein